MASVAGSGLLGLWCVRLETVNPGSRTPLTLPLVTAKVGGHRYLVSMLGQRAKWVRSVVDGDAAVALCDARRHVAVENLGVTTRDHASVVDEDRGLVPVGFASLN